MQEPSTVYNLRSLSLPKLYGTTLRLFRGLLTTAATRPLLLGSLLENGGIPKLRRIKLDEAPTFYPIGLGTSPATRVEAISEPQVGKSDKPEAGLWSTIGEFTAAYREKRTTPEEVAERFIAARDESQQRAIPLNAFIASYDDDIRAQAKESTRRIAEGRSRGPLEGVPVAVKDEVDMLPYPTTVGTSFLGERPAARDAEAVARLRAAGALLVGKTNMHEIGIYPNGSNVHYGRVANPRDPLRDSGGSSSGSAAAVGSGLVPAALGADGGGSIRIPSALCGLVGLKPGFGRISERGAAPLCWSVAHLGPIANSAEDAALLYSIMAGPDPEEPLTSGRGEILAGEWRHTRLEGLRVGVDRAWSNHANAEMTAAHDALIEGLKSLGASIVPIAIPELDEMRIAHAVTILAEMATAMSRWPEQAARFADSTRLSLTLGSAMSSFDYLQAQKMRTRAMAIFSNIFEGVDLILSPGTAIPAPLVPQAALSNGWSDLGTDTELMRYAFPANLTGLPAIVFPSGRSTDGLPLSVQAMSDWGDEHLLLRLAYASSRILPAAKGA